MTLSKDKLARLSLRQLTNNFCSLLSIDYRIEFIGNLKQSGKHSIKWTIKYNTIILVI